VEQRVEQEAAEQGQNAATFLRRLVDADKQQPLLNAVQHEGKAASSVFMDNNILPDTNGFSKFTIRTIGHGIDAMLSDFLKPYPITDKK
jgi:hypothetical protein